MHGQHRLPNYIAQYPKGEVVQEADGIFRQSVNRTVHDLTDSIYNFMKEVSRQQRLHKSGNE